MISVAIPAFNEEKRIREAVASVVAAAKEAGDVPIEVILIDDGSTDGTAGVIRELELEFPSIRSIRHPRNLGFGVSFLDAIRIARYEKISLFPGDAATSVYAMRNVFKNRDKADVVIGYFVNTEVRTVFRHAVSTIFNLIYCLTFDVHVRYLQGSPCFPLARLRELNIRSSGYGILAEINVKLLRSGASFIEVDGYSNPDCKKSSVIRLKPLSQVVVDYLRLVFEVLVWDRSRYRERPRRVLPS